MTNPSKAKTISEVLRNEILGGKFDSSKKLPSEHQLMRRFSVARETVRGALKELTERQLVEKRPGYGTFLAERAALKASQRFGVIVPDAYHLFYQKICSGIEEGARKRGWSILSASLGTGTMRERALKAVEFADICVREKVSGVFFQPLQFLEDDEKFSRAVLSVFDEARIPAVLLDSDIVHAPARSPYDLAALENPNAGYVLARHMIEAGAKRIAYFTNPRPAPTSFLRGDGIGLAMGEANLKWTRENVIVGDPFDRRLVKSLATGKKRPDAIIAVNDYIAEMLAATLAEFGVGIPGDMLLAGFNDDANAAKMNPPLTTMAQPCKDIGEAAVVLMERRLSEPSAPPSCILAQATLIVRQSTEKPKKEHK